MRNFLSVVAFLSFVLWSCVDIPESAPPLPDPQTVTRYIHLMTGVDTISYFLSQNVTQHSSGTRQSYTSLDTQVTRVVTIIAIDTTETRDTIVTSIETEECHSNPDTCYTSTIVLDSVAIHLNIRRDTLIRFDTTINVYNIIKTDTNKVKVTKSYYFRYVVNYNASLQLVIDGVSFGTLQFGDATTYRNMPSGDRKINLKAEGLELDTVEYIVIDTNHVVKRDTSGRGKYTLEETSNKKIVNKYAVSSPQINLIVADSTSPSLPHYSYNKATVFFVRKESPLFSEANGVVRFGVVNYAFGTERRSFTPSPSDSFGVRFVNVTKGSAGMKLTIRGIASNDTTPVTRVIDSVETSAIGGYQKFYNGVYSFYVSQGGSTAYKDSLPQLLMSGGRRMTLAVVENDSSFNFRKYDDD